MLVSSTGTVTAAIAIHSNITTRVILIISQQRSQKILYGIETFIDLLTPNHALENNYGSKTR